MQEGQCMVWESAQMETSSPSWRKKVPFPSESMTILSNRYSASTSTNWSKSSWTLLKIVKRLQFQVSLCGKFWSIVTTGPSFTSLRGLKMKSPLDQFPSTTMETWFWFPGWLQRKLSSTGMFPVEGTLCWIAPSPPMTTFLPLPSPLAPSWWVNRMEKSWWRAIHGRQPVRSTLEARELWLSPNTQPPSCPDW